MVEIPDDVISAAQAAQTKWRVPASISLAQWALESGWGNDVPAGSNNYFGVKAQGDEPFVAANTREFDKATGLWENVLAHFVKYPGPDESFDGHAQMLAQNPRYARCFAAPDALGFADALQACGYATDPNYAVKLRSILTGHALTDYDVG